MTISEQDLARVAELARLRLDPATVTEVTGRIGNILGMIDRMQAVDTSAVSPMAHPLDTVQRLRPDEVTEPDRRDDYQRGAPAVVHGLDLVPRVIE